MELGAILPRWWSCMCSLSYVGSQFYVHIERQGTRMLLYSSVNATSECVSDRNMEDSRLKTRLR